MSTSIHTVGTRDFSAAAAVSAVVVPHTHWDREWYAPFETMRFHLVRFFDELLDVLEADSELPTFLLDGQSVIIEDYLTVRPDQRDRVARLVSAGRLRPGPNYVQPDEFHVSGEALVRNLLIGCRVAAEFGWVTREGYMPDTFGHVHQLPQILRGFGIETFYAMRGFGEDPDDFGSQFWWEGPDGTRVLVEWLTESYSNAAVLTDDPATVQLHHGAIVRYDSLSELLDRVGRRAFGNAVLLLNGGDHVRVQTGLPRMVGSLDAATDAHIRLGSLEDFHELVLAGPLPETVVRGELRFGRLHAVFDGIGSTRTPLKGLNERTESHLTGVAERMDALATLVDGRSSADSVRYAWRELVKNYAHDSICGCSVDEVHDEMAMRFATIGQVSAAVADDALVRIAAAAAPTTPRSEIPVVVVNPSGYTRSGPVSVEVLPDVNAPVGQRLFGWTQAAGVDLSGYLLLDSAGRQVPFQLAAAARLHVADVLDRRKELTLDRVSFTAQDVPALGTQVYRLVPGPITPAETAAPSRAAGPAGSGTSVAGVLDNGILRVEVESGGALSITDHRSGALFSGLLGLLDDADAGDEYGFAPIPDDEPVTSDTASWRVTGGAETGTMVVTGALRLPVGLATDRRSRSVDAVDVAVTMTIGLAAGEDRVTADLTVDNQAKDHRLRLRCPTGRSTSTTIAESAFGVVRRDGGLPNSTGWQERPTGVFAMRRFVAAEDDGIGLQVLAEGLHEYSPSAGGIIDVTLLRSVGWMARVDHALRPHKIGPELPTPGAQCLGTHHFRLSLRPYAGAAGVGHLYRAAEEFSVPLQARSPWGRSAAVAHHPSPDLGLEVGPAAVIVTAVKNAESRNGLVLRVFNSSDEPVTATIRPGFAARSVRRCDLEEHPGAELVISDDGTLTVPLSAAEIASILFEREPLPSRTGRP